MTRTEQVFQFIKAFHALNGYAPTRREIGEACNISSTSAVSYQLFLLQEAGRLTVARDVARGIVLTEAAPDSAEWPVLNRVVAK